MKILVGLNNKNISDYLDYTKSFIIGIKDFSISYLDYSLKEIENLQKKYPDIELFISLNKNIFNSDLKELEQLLIKLDKLKVNGVLFYDLSILSIVKRLNLSIPLIWGQEHMTTNYNTCNYYLSKGCQYAYLSCEITEEEIKEIKENSQIKLISFLFGYPDVSFSKRKLLTNYFLHYNEKKNKSCFEIKSDDNHKYFVKENALGTRIIYGHILNGIMPCYNLMNVLDYGLLSEEMIEHDVFIKCLKTYKELIDQKIDKDSAFKKIKELTNSEDTVFYYQKTIYKVKDEKKN